MTTTPSKTRTARSGAGDRSAPADRGSLLYRIVVPPKVRRKRAKRAAAQDAGDGPLSGTRGGTRGASAAPRSPAPSELQTGGVTMREVGERPSRMARLLRWDRIEEPTIFTSTRQAEAINPALVRTHPPLAGPPAGVDVLTNNAVSADPHLLYLQKRITSPHGAILGAIGSGKSSFAMTHYVTRQVAMGKQVAVFDRKRQQGDGDDGKGEYFEAAQVCGGEIIRFSRAGGRSINLLDPRLATSSDGQAGVVGQDELLVLAAEYAHGPLNSKERAALGAAHRQAIEAARQQDRYANLHDVIQALFDPDPESIPHDSLQRRGLVDTDEVVRWGLDLALDLQRFVQGDLSGLIDADTSTSIDWDAPLLVFDTSELAENSSALSLVMMLVASFLSSVWSARPAQRVIILEEGYHTNSLEGAGTVTVAGILKSLLKRGRGIGLAFIVVIHHLSDIPANSDAISMIKETGIVHVYRQDKTDDIFAVLEQYGFPATIAETLRDLEQGVQVMRIGGEPPRLVRHVRSTLERDITDSDAAMVGRAKYGTGAAAAAAAQPALINLDDPDQVDQLDVDRLVDAGDLEGEA